jgi:hypothetical protein
MSSSPDLTPDVPDEAPQPELAEMAEAGNLGHEMAGLDQELAGLDTATRVRARDIEMAGVADLSRHVLMISGAIDTTDHDIALVVNLPEPGRWQVIKSETNLTYQTWVAMQISTDEESMFIDEPKSLVMCRQFAKSYLSPDQRRLTFYDGEVRPGEAVVKMYSMETTGNRPAYSYSRYSPVATDSPEQSMDKLERLVAEGMPQRQVVEVIVPVTVVG